MFNREQGPKVLVQAACVLCVASAVSATLCGCGGEGRAAVPGNTWMRPHDCPGGPHVDTWTGDVATLQLTFTHMQGHTHRA